MAANEADVLALARTCDDAANATPFDAAQDATERQALFNHAQALRGCAFNLRTAAADIITDDASGAITEINKQTASVKDVIAKLKAAAKAIAVMDDVIILANAVVMRKWGVIGPALTHLKEDAAA